MVLQCFLYLLLLLVQYILHFQKVKNACMYLRIPEVLTTDNYVYLYHIIQHNRPSVASCRLRVAQHIVTTTWVSMYLVRYSTTTLRTWTNYSMNTLRSMMSTWYQVLFFGKLTYYCLLLLCILDDASWWWTSHYNATIKTDNHERNNQIYEAVKVVKDFKHIQGDIHWVTLPL